MPFIGTTPLKNHELATRMVALSTTDIWNMKSTVSSPGHASCREESIVDILVTYEDDEFLMESEDLRLTQVETKRTFESALHVL